MCPGDWKQLHDIRDERPVLPTKTDCSTPHNVKSPESPLSKIPIRKKLPSSLQPCTHNQKLRHIYIFPLLSSTKVGTTCQHTLVNTSCECDIVMSYCCEWLFKYWSVSTHFLRLDVRLRAVLKTVAHIISCRHGRENDTYHIVYSCVQIVYSVLCIVYCSGKEVAAVPPHLALVAGSTL